jgi:phosphoglycolate phosphatase
MALINPELVLIDLDGTLVDSVPDMVWSVDTMLDMIGLSGRGEQKIRQWIGDGLENLIKCALTDDMHTEPDPELFNKAFPLFLELYADNTCRNTCIYDGVEIGLDYLKKNNYRLGCVTNKREQFTYRILETLDMYNIFDIIIAGDTLPKKKPDPLPLLHAAGLFNVKPENALMIGDNVNDITAARAAGFQIICVSYGYNQGRDIRDAGPDAVVDSLAQLPDLLNA